MKAIITIFFLVFSFNNSLFPQRTKLMFHSGFEPGTKLVRQTSSGADIRGTDQLFDSKNNWETNLEGGPNNCDFFIQYQGGNDTMRLAEIAPDPLDFTNNTLKFWLRHPNVEGTKGRVQGNLYNCVNGFSNLLYSIRLYLSQDLEGLRKNFEKFEFFTLMEFWNNAGWIDPDNGFRMTVNLKKLSPTSKALHFGVTGQVYDVNTIGYSYSEDAYLNYWDTTNTDFSVPISQWMTIEIHIVEGDSTNGRFFMTVKPDGEPKIILYDLTTLTHHPNDFFPDGIKHLNPFKLYTDSKMIQNLHSWGKVAKVYWDDFFLCVDPALISMLEIPLATNEFRVYPNPTNFVSILTFENSKNENHNLRLYNQQGRLVRKINNIKTERIEIEKKNLSAGIYFFQLWNGYQLQGSGKIIFQ